ncbi:FK506-binding protein-like [Hemicordylus capensis]|uniref:FK506-binding protein-like n=1 Tax=Hemicordylus capensis TaxID=884348 RepID=UPI002303C3B0|nr:FK506-binding protein-like [Hemicordylus capensis]XP_053151573.1 FK506-binding protein-like [Hemicordylus capensis]XP_053151574.1 FK506-binding protein-like [Hemicordylus capensis]XP_053151575.1 FK506-binding protein-like [Hemicordylus capensis]
MASTATASEKKPDLGGEQKSKNPNQGPSTDEGNRQDADLEGGEKESGTKLKGEDLKENQPLPNQPRSANRDVPWTCPDGTFVKLVLETGTGLDKPKEGSVCQVFIETEPGSPLSYPSQNWAEVELGGGDADWDGIVDRGLETMLAGEQAELRLTGGGSIMIQLASFTQAKDSWEMSASEKWNLVIRNKERGSELYRAGDISAAARRYARALRLLVVAAPPPDYDQIKAELHANLAACQLRLRQPANAACNCTKTLALQPTNTKALFRRGLAYDAMNDLEGAAQDLKGVLQVEAGNRAARRELERVMERIRVRDAKLARAMQKMFG